MLFLLFYFLDPESQNTILVFESDDLISGPFGKSLQVLLRCRIVAEYLQYLSYPDSVDLFPGLKQRLRAIQADTIQSFGRFVNIGHSFSC